MSGSASADGSDVSDEQWIVNQATLHSKSDLHAAKSWLIVGRSLFSRNFDIQFEMYRMEKSANNIRDGARLFEELATNFSQEPRLLAEMRAISEALQSDFRDENSIYLRELFGALPSSLQCSILLRVVDTAADVLSQCRLFLLVVDRYPNQLSDQGVHLVEVLLQAEKKARCTMPVNCYRKYLACDLLPVLLRGAVQVATHAQFFVWLEKSIEFFVCYISQSLPEESGKMLTQTVTIDGLNDKESIVSDPWSLLYQLMQSASQQLQWKTGKLFHSEGQEAEVQQLIALHDNVSGLPKTSADIPRLCNQLFYLCLVVFLRSLHGYVSATELAVAGGSILVLVEVFAVDRIFHQERPQSKKLKIDLEIPDVLAPENLSSDAVTHLSVAFRCWQLLSSDVLRNEFQRVCQQWSANCWTMLQQFEVDASICQARYQDALLKLQSLPVLTSSTNVQLRSNLQMACCYCCHGNYVKCCQLLLHIVASQSTSKDQMSTAAMSNTSSVSTAGRHRQLQLIQCTDNNVLSYVVSLLIACLQEKALKTSASDDLLLGHMTVLMQYDWPKYETQFCDLIRTIAERRKFTYNLFFTYVINVDMLEEFAYVWTQGVVLDLLPTSAKARAVTRGVNKVVKEDLKMALERQVSRSHENVVTVLRTFLVDEAELLQQNLA